MKWLLGVAMLLQLACSRENHSEACIGTAWTDSSEAYSICVPPGWSVKKVNYFMGGRLQVFAVLKNQAAAGLTPGLHPQEFRWPLTELPQQMPAGGAIVTFSRFLGGPPPLAKYAACTFSRDDVGENLDSLLDTLHAKENPTGRDALYFRKWGRGWHVNTFWRSPSRADRRAIERLFRSVAFVRTPVVSADQASHLAYESLPSEETRGGPRDSRPCIAEEVVQSDGVFHVTLHRCGYFTEGPGDFHPADATWSFNVYPDGTVERVPVRSAAGEPPNRPYLDSSRKGH